MAPGTRRVAAIAALLLPPAVLALAIGVMLHRFPAVLIVSALLLIGGTAAWYGLLRNGVARVLGLAIGTLALAASVVLLLTNGDHVGAAIAIVAGLGLAAVAARTALSYRPSLPEAASPPRRAVLFYNPKSGGGKAEKFRLDDEARKRGIEPIELKLGTDLEQLVRGAAADGADALAMAGGDGSQAVVAAVAAELDLPYSCIPAGTRNHFALDLGVDRDDVVGALDAFGPDARERRVDLAEVNGRVFVNNVSLGLYAEAVQHKGYRDAKIRTILDTVPQVLGPKGEGLDLRWTGPDGEDGSGDAVILVANNRYRLGHVVASGTRPRMDEGVLGITVMDAPGQDSDGRQGQGGLWREWTAPEFVLNSSSAVPAGIDGEAVKLDAPLRFRSRPDVLRVRIAAQHPGASPSANIPESTTQAIRALARIATGSSL